MGSSSSIGGLSGFPVVTTDAAVAGRFAEGVVTGEGVCGFATVVTGADAGGVFFAAGAALGDRSTTGAAVGVAQEASNAEIANAAITRHFPDNEKRVMPILPQSGGRI